MPKPSDIVGGTTPASLRSMKLEDLPQERVSMAAVELEAMTRTIYRRKKLKFSRHDSLDFDEPIKQSMRGWLSEPVGRFYLHEYAKAKGLVDFEARVGYTALIVKLVDEVGKEGRFEKEETGVETDEERLQRMDLWTRNAYEQFVASSAGKLGLSGFVTEESDEHKRLLKAREECAKYANLLVPGTTLSPYERAAARTAMMAVLTPLMHSTFRHLCNSGQAQQYREHSEYKRYKAKFSQCYNSINHEDFQIMAVLGKGSFGRVLRVRKTTTGKQYAMKIMSKKKILSGAENAAQVTIERNVLVMCNSPSIVKVHFAFHTTRALFLVLDLLEGGTLVHAMNQCSGVIPVDVVQFHTAQMVLGLEHLHDHGILFRDLKPLNVLLDRKGNAVLTDMGLACKFRASRMPEDEGGVTAAGQPIRRVSIPILPKEKLKCVGTYGFRAPELLDTENDRHGYGPAVDYWALGVTVYYMLTAKMPFKVRQQSIMEAREKPKETERRLQKNPPRISPDLPVEAQDLVKGLLKMEPVERYGDGDLPGFKAHAFFRGIDWEKLSRRELQSPYKPGVPKHPKDEAPQFESVHAAMAQFTHENVLEMFGGENEIKDEYQHVSRQDQKHFRSWDYIPDGALELEWDISEKNTSTQIFRRRQTNIISPTKLKGPTLTEGAATPNNGRASVVALEGDLVNIEIEDV